MPLALSLAARGLGSVWPNPAVGCVIVKKGRILGRGWTHRGGRPHAETIALAQAGAEARGATALVTLEPCAHHGQTPPCAEALIKAGIAECVIACRDPDPRVNGQGIALLQAAGIKVHEGVMREEAERLNRGFFSRIQRGRPWLALKIASSQDGKIALGNGESRWITGERAREHGHALRTTHDAVLTGINTALADDPRLTCRLPGLERPMLRIVLDSHLRLDPESALAREAKTHPLWVMALASAPAEKKRALQAAGAEIIEVAEEGGKLSLSAALQALGARGLTRVMAEAGPKLHTALITQGLADAIHWFRAPALLGGQGRNALEALPEAGMEALARARVVERRILGEDVLETLEMHSS